MLDISRPDSAHIAENAAGGEALTLVSFDLCPYVQRAAIALREKGAPYARVDIDLANKPAWFLEISPLGKVPLLKVGGDAIFESAAIVEYLEETGPNPLHPASPLIRARHRAWMELGSSILGDIWIIETTPDAAKYDAARQAVRMKFMRLEGALGAGPYFAGEKFSLVDAVFAPVFRYFDVFDAITDLAVFDGLDKAKSWRAALAARPSVKAAVAPDYPNRLRAFLCKQNSVLASKMA